MSDSDGWGSSPVRVLMVVGHAAGGIGAHAASLVAGLRDSGVRVVVVTSAATADRFDLGTQVERAWPGRDPRTVWRAVRRVRRLASQADVVHAQGHQAGLLALVATMALPGRRVPVVVSWHNAVLGGGVGRRVRAVLERVQARGAALVTGASQDLVDRATVLGARQAELAAVAAPQAGGWTQGRSVARAELAAELGLDPAGGWLLTVSRIAPQKNLDTLVRAAALVPAGQPDGRPLTWLVIGEGVPALRESLQAEVGTLDAPVRFLGARPDVQRWMAAADAFVLPSAWEARALVVQEALAAGLPVVASAVGGLPELVGDAGVLVPAGDAAALADAVARLLADDERRAALGAAGRRRFAELPDAHDVLVGWLERYRALIGRRGR